MKIDILVFEIGSTTTVVNAFDGIHDGHPQFLGQGQAPTSVLAGDVTIGLNQAIEDLKTNLKIENLEMDEVFATSSAAGGLKMTVHGLVYDMTVKAAKEAALGAGANIHHITSGKLNSFDCEQIKRMKPNIILVAGGVDYGEKETALHNAELIAKLKLGIPVIYAGNCVNQDAVKFYFDETKQGDLLHIVDNVYPKIDALNVEPTRKVIQNVFEEHIIHAPGMNQVKDIVNQHIMPTPGAVMLAAKLLEETIGDLIVFDVGGATTDLHSVTSGSEKVNRILIHPEPKAKRTVEGDLGVYVNRQNIIDMIGLETLSHDLSISLEELHNQLADYQAIPNEAQIPLVERLTLEALIKALERHCGQYRHLYGTRGRTQVAEGKDLTNVQFIVGTGGALTRLPNRILLLKTLLKKQDPSKLVPQSDAKILIDNDYIMASIGVISQKYPKQALELLKNSFGI